MPALVLDVSATGAHPVGKAPARSPRCASRNRLAIVDQEISLVGFCSRAKPEHYLRREFLEHPGSYP